MLNSINPRTVHILFCTNEVSQIRSVLQNIDFAAFSVRGDNLTLPPPPDFDYIFADADTHCIDDFDLLVSFEQNPILEQKCAKRGISNLQFKNTETLSMQLRDFIENNLHIEKKRKFFDKKELILLGTERNNKHLTNPKFYEKVKKQLLLSEPFGESLSCGDTNDVFILINAPFNDYKPTSDKLREFGLIENEHFTSLENYCYLTDTAKDVLLGWQDTESKGIFTASSNEHIWGARVQLMAGLIDPNCKSLAEFGCGCERLKNFIPQGLKYIGIDYIKRSEYCIVCDCNNDPLPILNCDCIFMSGSFEYFQKPVAFVEYLQKLPCSQVILSYTPLELRTGLGYRYCEHRAIVNFFTSPELIELFQKAGGFVLNASKICHTSKSQVLYDFRRK